MDKVNKQELRRLAEKATPGRWITDGDAMGLYGNVVGAYVAHEDGGRIGQTFANCLVPTDAKCRSNASFIAAANPPAILSLLDELEENDGVIAVWRGRLQRAEAELEQYRKDAERYRWLRKQHNDEHNDTGVFDAIGVVLSVDGELDLDAWADTEMAKEGGANG